MTVREAAFDDTLEIAELLFRKAKGKTTEHLCRSRVHQAIKRSLTVRTHLCKALVATEEGHGIRGFLYCEERLLFDLLPNMRVIEVPFLVGSHGAGVALLKRLRSLTVKRILVEHVAWYGSTDAFRRLLSELRPRRFATTFEL